MDIRQINWQQTIPNRHQVLWPNEKPEFCFVDGDETALHFGAFDQQTLVCVASIYVNQEYVNQKYVNGNAARLRKFATLAQYQGMGVGSRMLKFLIEQVKALNTDYFWFDARESALGFYQKFGFVAEGERFYKKDVAYFKMQMRY
ncbi:GNAT family N-acetyltransferase [Saccharobesus litoralis]|uniref:GNAT family N-acetyltransferase n=1 Tax=Saccharobesus litoralis TaxID=2172099 RepID=A0A2S0VSJ6_9ALTE|nr:GNAT family N-acetyltransferase [Saccharobesus litoralis]AWB67179.1 GNAT family N-acetyltransferase [Saccharobesus litoralis]